MKNEYHQIITYGSLREGCYNRKAHIPKAISLGTVFLEGFKLYRRYQNKRINDTYPFAVRSKLKSAKIKVELLLLTSAELRKVQKLENQYLTIPIMIKGYENPFLMFIQDKQYLESLNQEHVISVPGNWIPYSRRNGIM